MRVLPRLPIFSGCCLLVGLWISPGHVYGLATEQFGNGPINFGFDAAVLKIANRASRVYWYEVNGNPQFFFRGNAADVNQGLALFVALSDANKEIILLPGPGETHSLGGKVVAYDWSLHVPRGLRLHKGLMADNRATLEIHITQPGPRTVDPAKVKRLLAQLDDPHFRVREQARKQLVPLVRDAEPILREALADHPSSELRGQIERLLGQLTGLSLNQLRIPNGVAVIDSAGLEARYLRGLASHDPTDRGMAAMALAGVPGTHDALERLQNALKAETHEYAERCLAAAFSQLGAQARPALAELQKYTTNGDKNVAQAFEQTIRLIREAKPKSLSQEQRKTEQTIQKEIEAFCRRRT